MNIVDIAEFYSHPLGRVTQGVLAAKLKPAVVVPADQLVLGLGYASPYIQGHERALSFMMARAGVIHWPEQGKVRSALVDELDLPLGDNVVDVALLVHALEFAESAEELMEEVWRVLSPQGRLIVVVPNRRGFWSVSDASPFGQGQPFSTNQLMTLLKAAQFSLKRVDYSLIAPPWLGLPLMKGLEPLGRTGIGRMGGVIVIEAVKQIHAYSTGKLVRRALPRLRPVLLPNPQPAGRGLASRG
ncbi:class I SAM-dependent methyltransferase [Aestuariivirga litoralis]|uniref:class I SAM-dependent methyltransferase n=1 Tax=Aestuariivirga litoralis TaxID=2650924 RepID=UPI0018C5E687|nr:methyltransferase domain-containing protein [Aestuariivirga litoralis]MBG1233712.1 class I SAM-dependent methyltransferase [Aestuariivirga litoralis]